MANTHDTEDHPRVGGEKPSSRLSKRPVLGSPPRGRGKGGKVIFNQLPRGITPAWAGKSLAGQSAQTLRRDHPRVGGEKGKLIPFYVDEVGSPPRGRGKDLSLLDRLLTQRITPAWAGKSRPRAAHPAPGRDHPRVGGEKLLFVVSRNLCLGSPPRGRGKVTFLLF